MLQQDLIKAKASAAQRDFPAERKELISQLKPLLAQEGTQVAQAEIWLKMAALAEDEKGAEAAPEIGGYLSSVTSLLSAPDVPHDVAYVNVCRAAAPVLERFSRKAEATALLQSLL